MTGAKDAIRTVLRLMVTAGVFGPGTWNAVDTIGNPEDMRRNILETGYYIFSFPIATQAQAERASRIAPVIQFAAKESGAIHSGDVIFTIEA